MEPRLSLLLRQRDRPTAVAALAVELGLSPKRLLEAVEELVRLGFQVELQPHLGLRLISAPPRLFEEEVACGLDVLRVGRRVRCVQATSSTNDLAWEAAAAEGEAADGLAIFAEYQSAGRGRRGSPWIAPAHSSILCSVILWVPDSPQEGSPLTRAAAVAVAEAIEAHTRLAVRIKWPNDLVVDGRKVAGILVEARPGTGGRGPVVLGAGINCAQGPDAFPPDIRPSVASLAMLGEEVDRTLLARSLLERMDRVVRAMADETGVAGLRQEAARRCGTLGQRITVVENGEAYAGEVIDLDPDYGLILRLPEGGIRRFLPMTSHVAAGRPG